MMFCDLRKPILAISSLIALIIMNQVNAEEAYAEGKALFLANCAECHQPDGQGMTNVYPALAGNETVQGSGADVALVLIIGRGEMPSFAGALSNQEMADVINYVRNSWGNVGTAITAESVGALQ